MDLYDILFAMKYGHCGDYYTDLFAANTAGEWKTVSGPIVHITDAKASKVKSLKAQIEPVQDGTPWIGSDEFNNPYLSQSMPQLANAYNTEMLKKVVGGTVAWNQLADPTYMHASGTESDVAFTKDGGKLTVSGTASANIYARVCGQYTPISGHKMLYIGAPSEIANVTFYDDSAVRQFDGKTTYALINASGVKIDFKMRISSGSSVNGTVIPQIFDLTQMFGSTIADYIYALETANAGAGVAWFKKHFPKPYYAYNAGELMSVKALRHITRGFNAWDEEWEVGGISNDTGETISSSDSIRSKNFIPVVPQTSYYIAGLSSGILRPMFYDADKNFIGAGYWAGGTSNNPQSTPSGCYYMKFKLTSAYGTTYNHDICINLHWDGEKDGTYEPYTLHTYAFDPTVELRGVPKLKDGKMYFDGDRYLPDGTVNRRYGERTITDITISPVACVRTANNLWCAAITGVSGVLANKEVRCDKIACYDLPYNTMTNDGISQSLGSNQSGILCLTDSTSGLSASSTTSEVATAFSTYLNTLQPTIVYPLATPTTETATPYTQAQTVDASGTEEFTAANIVPVGHVSTFAKICPISGHTGVTVEKRGKNLWNSSVEPALMDVFGISGNAIRRMGFAFHLPPDTYTISAKQTATNGGYIYLNRVKNDGSFVSFAYIVAGSATTLRTATITLADGEYIVVYDGQVDAEGHPTHFANFDIQLELGSTATDYEAFKGETIPVSWESEAGTVYGGTLDVVSGVLTVDRAYALLDDASKWIISPISNTTPYTYDVYFRDRKIYADSYTNLMCSVMPVNSQNQNFTARWTGATALTFGIKAKNPEIPIDVFKDLSSRGEISICYELATPITYHLTPQEVRTFLGQNNIWNDVGDTEVTYRAKKS